MRSPRPFSLAAALSAVVVLAACADRRPDATAPNGAKAAPQAQASVTMGTCTTISQLNALAAAVFGSGSPNVNSVLGKLDNLNKKVLAGDVQGAQDQANNIVSFVQEKAAQGTLPGTQAQITAFISGVLCFAGLSPDTYLILPGDSAQIRIASNGLSGVSLQANTVTTPTLLTINTLDPSGPAPLDTKLDQYATYIDIRISSPITKAAIVAVCPVVSVPPEVRDRLRLGHQASSGFEITPPADGGFLPCSTSTAQSTLPGWLRTVASLFVPRPAYAAVRVFTGGVGGLATEFSPFGAVDPTLSVSGGVGGLATEFKRTPADTNRLRPTAPNRGPTLDVKPGAGALGAAGSGPAQGGAAAPVGGRALTVVNGVCTAVTATVGTGVEPECRPLVTLTTHNGTIMTNVPVDWNVTRGGGSIAAEAVSTKTCGAYGRTASTTTDANGQAGVCWTLGIEADSNKVNAVPSAGGDAPAGVTFSPAGLTFTAIAIKITPTATATGGSFTFDNQPHAGSGTCSNGLSPALTYSGDGSVPAAAGNYTLTVTCGAGSNTYNTVTATATISIAAAVPAITISCPDTVVYDGSAKTPCTASATAPGLSLTPTPSYTGNINVGTATAAVNLPANGNYAAASASATFAIVKAYTVTTVTCAPSTVTYTGAAQTPCSPVTTGPGLNITTAAMSYANNTNAGTATATGTYGGGDNYRASSGTASFTINQASSATSLSCPSAVTYTGAVRTPCTAAATGTGGLNASLTVSYANNVNAGTATASAAYAGDANHTGSSGSATFQINPAGTSVAVNCSNATYNGAAQSPCTAAATGPDFSGLAAPVSYAPSPVRNVGGYTATGTYAGGGNYLGSVSQASFSITALAAAATAGSATINFGDPVPALSCTLSGVLGVDAGAVSCTTTVPAVTVASTYTTTPVVSGPAAGNYAFALNTGTLTVMPYVQVGCFSSPIYSVMPSTKSAQKQGSNLPVKCTLDNQQGAAVTTAHGDLYVYDVGTTATTPPALPGPNQAPVFTALNAFSYSNGGNYSYGLNTSNLVAGHYYYVFARWNDGSTTNGWFLLK